MVRKEQPRSNGNGGDEPRRPLPGVALLPSAATLGNLLCGFFAVLCCLLAMRAAYFDLPVKPRSPRMAELFDLVPTYITGGAFLIIAAMIFDALDGRLARMARRTSEFGAQLDSIADVVSFGAAPALLFIALLLPLAVPAHGIRQVSPLERRIGLLGAMVYVSCAAIRLARYNAENVKEEAGQRKFTGLPTPGAAAALVALLALHEDLVRSGAEALGIDWANLLRWAIGPIAFLLGVLMVSRLDFVHVFNAYFRRERPPTHLVIFLVALGIGWYWPQMLLVILAYAYIIGSLITNIAKRWRPPAAPPAGEPEPQTDWTDEPIAR